MRMVYNLDMIDLELSYDNHTEGFNIGFFSSRDKAEKTARRYLTEVSGFKDYNVTYEIMEKCVIGSDDNEMPSTVFIIYGWNENDEMDEIDIIESDCYIVEQEAEEKLSELQSSYSRTEWCIDRYAIDECNWREGFVRV